MKSHWEEVKAMMEAWLWKMETDQEKLEAKMEAN
jgi:hypothetical protein